MGTFIAIILLLIAVALFIIVQRKIISSQTLELLANIGTVVAVVAAILIFVVPAPQSNTTLPPIPEGSTTPTSNFNSPDSIETLTSQTQTQVINFTPTLDDRLYTIEFVAGPIPADGESHNVYYSVDNGAEQYLFTAGNQVNHTFTLTFSQSVRMRVAVKSGTVLHEELYVNGNLVTSSDSADNNGLIYQIPLP